MPSSDYAHSGGALKLKGGGGGGKISKSGKKKKASKTKALDADDQKLVAEHALSQQQGEKEENDDGDDGAAALGAAKAWPRPWRGGNGDGDGDGEGDEGPVPSYKTGAERRYEEVQRRKLERLAESSDVRPELLKTHKERVEELNTYLSKLSEHHDMPKIGPG